MLFTFKCLLCWVWYFLTSSKVHQHCLLSLFQIINIRLFFLVFHHFSSFFLSFSPEFFVDFSFLSHDSLLESQLTFERDIILAMINFIDSVFTSFIWSRLISCNSAYNLPCLMTRTCCSSRFSSVSSQVIIKSFSTFSSFSLSVFQYSIHNWSFTSHFISMTIISYTMLSHRHCHDKSVSKMKSAQNHHLCIKTYWINVSHHLERVFYCVIDK